MRAQLAGEGSRSERLIKLNKVVTLPRECGSRNKGSSRIHAYATHDKIMGLRRRHKAKPYWLYRVLSGSWLGHFFPDLKHTWDVVGLSIDKKGVILEADRKAFMVKRWKGPLETGFLKGAGKNKGDPFCAEFCRSPDELSRETTLTTKGRITEEYEPARWCRPCEEIGFLNARGIGYKINGNRRYLR